MNLPRWIMSDIEEFIELNNLDVNVKDLTKRQILDYYLKWNGIVGYTDTIIAIVGEIFDEIDEVDFDEKVSE